MHVLITGGGGYLGTVLVRLLVNTRPTWRVTVLDRFTWGTQPLAAVADTTIGVIAGDLRDPRIVHDAVQGIDAIVHLAAIVGYPACDADPDDAYTTNVVGTDVLARAAGPRPILLASTGSTYGRVDGRCTEDTPLSPLTLYGRTKAEAERIVTDAGGCCLRFATLYGMSPRMRWDLLPHDFARRGVQGEIRVYAPEARRTFLPVQEAAETLDYFLAGISTIPVGTYNIGHELLNLTKLDVAKAVQRVTDCSIQITEGTDPDGRDYEVSYEKFRSLWHDRMGSCFFLSDVVKWAEMWR